MEQELPHRLVVSHPHKTVPHGHERMTLDALARRLAMLMGWEYGGTFEPCALYTDRLYFVPDDTLTVPQAARDLGILDEGHLFGGVVPYPFVATKTITHPLPRTDASAPDGWSHAFGQRVREAVLPGFSAFDMEDARAAGRQLLAYGAVRVKQPGGVGGLGQDVVRDAGELDAHLSTFDHAQLAREGLVLEQDLEEVNTHSVGQVRIGRWLLSYCGVQRLTHNNRGKEVYGGSELFLVRGGFDTLEKHAHAPEVRTAIRQARIYHEAALASYPGMFASRCNYDVAQGRDAQGNRYSGVLEQSWRIGGASGAEIAALEAFRADPTLTAVRASTTETYGDHPAVPEDASVYFCGVDPKIGPLLKYSRVETE